VEAGSLNAAMMALCSLFTSEHGYRETERRGGAVRELRGPALIEISEPARGLLVLPGRNDNPWTNLAEFPWLVAGRGDVAWLGHYLPRAVDYSDDGQRWRAAYGPRLRAWNGGQAGVRFDQLERLVQLFGAMPDTRQAVVSLWDQRSDGGPGEQRFKDYPCTNWLHFTVDPEYKALDLSVVMRSNDLFWGFSAVNVLNFTLLQQLVAACLGLGVGTYRHVSNNLHVYERHFRTAERLAQVEDDLLAIAVYPDDARAFGHWRGPAVGTASLGAFTRGCEAVLYHVSCIRGDWMHGQQHAGYRGDDLDLGDPRVMTRVALGLSAKADPWLVEWAYMMLMHDLREYEHGWDEFTQRCLLGIARPDWRLAASCHLARLWQRTGRLDQQRADHMAHTIAASLGAGDGTEPTWADDCAAAERLLLDHLEEAWPSPVV
jgi:thymidylate synthase